MKYKLCQCCNQGILEAMCLGDRVIGYTCDSCGVDYDLHGKPALRN
jgi:hypothetical protein